MSWFHATQYYTEKWGYMNDRTLLCYDIKKFNFKGLNVYVLDGGMSAEASV
jgi:hypothetical protein